MKVIDLKGAALLGFYFKAKRASPSGYFVGILVGFLMRLFLFTFFFFK